MNQDNALAVIQGFVLSVNIHSVPAECQVLGTRQYILVPGYVRTAKGSGICYSAVSKLYISECKRWKCECEILRSNWNREITFQKEIERLETLSWKQILSCIWPVCNRPIWRKYQDFLRKVEGKMGQMLPDYSLGTCESKFCCVCWELNPILHNFSP